ncbi:hypothetical protein SCP_1600880 [Sparassis crispa]|uniref:Protein kinase domain-containing protein n=1 Tax=Sparassis crispa TaxID=139825 RepID=A0A401H4Q0_9APHY|nr:hypothetical protein SCP_1600880 [Sparassis crispa]GBE89426.1 hypothetical protein SCP_1600880 [Sparassis crispa]
MLPDPMPVLHESPRFLLCKYKENVVVKPLHAEEAEYEILTTLLAGPDCAVQQIGRIIPFDDNSTKEEKRPIVQSIRKVVKKLHSTGTIHGSIQPSHLLLCSDGQVRPCGFSIATSQSMRHADVEKLAGPTRYSSPPHHGLYILKPATKHDDLYATGITIWEFWTGRISVR